MPGTPDYTSLPLRQPPSEPGGHNTQSENKQHRDDNVQGTQRLLAEKPSASSQQASGATATPGEETLPTLPQKRPAAVLVSSRPLNFDFHDDASQLRRRGRPQQHSLQLLLLLLLLLQVLSEQQHPQGAGATEEPEKSDESSDDDQLSASNSRTQRRKELKQLDREIPWRQLVGFLKPWLDAHLDAARVEKDNLDGMGWDPAKIPPWEVRD